MYKIAINNDSQYADISAKSEISRAPGFYAKEKAEISYSYDIRTNESKMQKIRMREIKSDEKK